LGDPGPHGDLLHRRAVVAVGGEHLAGHFEQLGAARPGAQSLGCQRLLPVPAGHLTPDRLAYQYYRVVTYQGRTRSARLRGSTMPTPKGRGGIMPHFGLTEEQVEFRKWLHEFAEKEIRPVASHYDETEEFPWPVVKKAAEIGLYSMDFWMQTAADETGISMPIALEEICWGCAGIGLCLFGSGLPLAAIANAGTPEQLMKFAPMMFGTP